VRVEGRAAGLVLICALGGCFDFAGLRERTASDGGLGSPGGPSLCPGGLAFCDGLENGVQLRMEGLWSIDDSKAYRGSHSLAFHLDGGSGQYQRDSAGTASPGLVSYSRVFTILPAGFDSRIASYYDGASKQVLELRSSGSALSFGQGVTGNSAPVETGTWTCIEWMVDRTTGVTKVWLNEREALSGVAVTGAFDLFTLWGEMNAGPPRPDVDFWLDEVALDASPIGCSR